MNHDAMRVQQIAEVTTRDAMLEIALIREQEGMEALQRLGRRNPEYAYRYKALCDESARGIREIVKEAFL